MPRRLPTIIYKGLEFHISKSGKQRKERPGRKGYYYAATLYFQDHGKILEKRYVRSKTLHGLDEYIEKSVLPEMYEKVLIKLKQKPHYKPGVVSIDLMWNYYKEEIASRFKWNAEGTIKLYTELLEQHLLPPISKKEMKHLTLDDYRYAVECAMNELNTDDKSRERDLFLLLSRLSNTACMLGVCDDDPLDGYLELFRVVRSPVEVMRDRFRNNQISHQQEICIYREIEKHLEENGLYLGLALMLFAGLTPKESCALRRDDIKKASIFPQISCIYIDKECPGEKENEGSARDEGDLLTSVYDYRRIPVHPRLAKLLERKAEINLDRGLCQDQNYYLVTKTTTQNNQGKPSELKALHSKVLKQAGVDLEDGFPVGSNKGKIRFAHLNILRDNFVSRLRAVGLTEDETLYLTGRRTKQTYSLHYRDWVSDYTQMALYVKMCRWNWKNESRLGCNHTEEMIISANKKTIFEEDLPAQPALSWIRVIPTVHNESSGNTHIELKMVASNGFFGKIIKTKKPVAKDEDDRERECTPVSDCMDQKAMMDVEDKV